MTRVLKAFLFAASVFIFAVTVPAIFVALGFHFSTTTNAEAEPTAFAVRYHLDPSKSNFIVHASRGGLAWFKGHDHLIAARDFSGVAELNMDAVNPASLQLTVRSASLEETSDVFTPQQKGIIKKELEDIVLETAKYPEITFRSTDVKGDLKGGQFDVKIDGDMTLHGVTRRITIPATVTIEGDSLRAKGKFKLDRSDYNVKATSAFHGMVRVKDTLKFTFDIVGQAVRLDLW